jgi:hypothetical protein
MAKFVLPKGVSAISAGGNEYEAVDGIIEIPDGRIDENLVREVTVLAGAAPAEEADIVAADEAMTTREAKASVTAELRRLGARFDARSSLAHLTALLNAAKAVPLVEPTVDTPPADPAPAATTPAESEAPKA